MRILLLDIETAPNVAFVWGLWQQNIGINQIDANGYVLCWSAKWLGEDEIMFGSVQHGRPKRMLSKIHKLLDQADAVVHYNGKKFDIPTLNKEFLQHGFPPPSPYKQIDLYQICKSTFRFVSNKLDYVSSVLGHGQKVRHPGHELWVGCMNGDASSWALMEKYNKQDVALLEPMYLHMRPWIRTHPSHGAIEGVACCPKCGSEEFQRRGYAYTTMYKYPRYRCSNKACGGWFRGNKTVNRSRDERMTNIAE